MSAVRKTTRSVLIWGAVFASLAVLPACQTLDEFSHSLQGLNTPDTVSETGETTARHNYFASIPADKLTTEPRRLVAEAIQALKEQDLARASLKANQALSLDVTNSYLQFLNGFVYHQQSLDGDSTKADLAAEGYKLAIQFDQTNWIARYHLGLLHQERREWDVAQKLFAETLHYNADDPGVLYNMAVASYYSHDPVTAAATLDRLRRLKGFGKDPRVLQASSMVMAALDKPDDAERFLGLYKEASASGAQAAFLGRRLRDWRYFHKNKPSDRLAPKAIPAQMVQVEPLPDPNQPQDQMTQEQPQDQMMQEQPAEQEQQFEQDQSAEQAQEEEQEEEPEPLDENSMVIVDVVIIRTEETYTTSKGVNLLNGLQLQFGGGATSTSTTALGSYVPPRCQARTRSLRPHICGMIYTKL